MPLYNVTWEIDIEADTPEEAAREARKYQRDGTWVGVFNVYDERGDGHHVDLDELDEAAQNEASKKGATDAG